MHLVYYAHSYRKPDDELNEMFEELMVSEGMTPSIDPPSDRLNSAKPERHLRSTDGMVCVLPYREGGPSNYILYEIALAMRGRRPVLVFVEDVLPSNVIPSVLMGRRFSRRSFLRQIRDQRHALRIFKAYVGEEPPPSYQPSPAQRSCLIIGASCVTDAIRQRIYDQIVSLRYSPVFAACGEHCLAVAAPQDEGVARASFAVAFTENLSPQEYYCLGAVRAAITPTIMLTSETSYPYDPGIPVEYQPRIVDIESADSICEVISKEVATYEEDYLDLKDQQKVERYKRFKAVVLNESAYSTHTRSNVVNYVIDKLDMSQNKTEFRDNYGNINIGSYLENVTQTINASSSLQPEKRQELAALVQELKGALEPVSKTNPEDSARVAETLELAVKEATKAKPNPGFLKITAEGLKEAANALKDVAPAVLAVTGKVVQWLLGLGV